MTILTRLSSSSNTMTTPVGLSNSASPKAQKRFNKWMVAAGVVAAGTALALLDRNYFNLLPQTDDQLIAKQKEIAERTNKWDDWFNVGSLYENQDKYTEAAEAYEKCATQISKSNQYCMNAIERLANNINIPNLANIREKFNQAIGDLIASQKATVKQTNNHYDWFDLGSLYERQGNNTEAVNAYEKCAGQVHQSNYYCMEAIDQLAKKITIPNLAGIRQKYDSATNQLIVNQRKQADRTNDVYDWFDLGKSYERQGNNTEAAKVYEKCAIEVKNRNHYCMDAIDQLANKIKIPNLDQIRENYNEAVANNPS